VKSRHFAYGDAADIIEQLTAELGDAAPQRSSHFGLGPALPGPPAG